MTGPTIDFVGFHRVAGAEEPRQMAKDQVYMAVRRAAVGHTPEAGFEAIFEAFITLAYEAKLPLEAAVIQLTELAEKIPGILARMREVNDEARLS